MSIIENMSFKTILNDSTQNIFENVFSVFFSSIKRSDSFSLPLFEILSISLVFYLRLNDG